MIWTKLSALAVLLLALVVLKPAKSGYVITTPRVYRSGSTQTLNVDLRGDSALWNVTAFLKNTRSKKIISQSSKTLRGNSQDTIEIQVPESMSVSYNQFNNVFLQVHGVAKGKPEFWSKQALTLEKQEDTLFIQTDKPIYKPGQTIRMRVVGVKPDLKPLVGKVERISISNAKGVRMMQWNNMDFKNGIVGVEIVLSKYPVLGKWKIQAGYKGKQIRKFIEVSKYVLPKFEVVIKPPSFIAVDSKIVTGSICGKYTYGQKVTGTVKAVFEFQVILRWGIYGWPWQNYRRYMGKKFTIEKKVKGCYEFSFTNKELSLSSLGRNYNPQDTFLNITAEMTEEATGIKRNATSTKTNVVQHRVKLNLNIGKHFKPGLPFYGKLQVTSPAGEPIAQEKVTIQIQDHKWKNIFKKELLSPSSGIIDFSLDQVPLNAKKLSLLAKHTATIRGLSNSERRKTSLPWFSPSSSFLSLKKVSRPLKVGNTAKIDFQCTLQKNQNISTFVYSLMCGGKVRASEEITIPIRQIKSQMAEGSIQFVVTQAMVPSCRLLVYYIRTDDETVADSMAVDIEDKLENQVVVRFSNNVRRPGEPVQITMAATPGSTVALAGVDKSIRLLRQDQDLDSNKVVSVLSSNDVGPSNQHYKRKKCYKDDYVDASKAFYDAGLVYMSDATIELRPCRPFPTRRPFAGPWPVWVAGGGGGGEGGFHFLTRRLKMRPQNRRLGKPKKRKKEITKAPAPTPTVRKNFPETWLWTEETISNINGTKIITAKVPDTITSWYLSAFAMSSSSGMGVADPSSLTVFQPFFVSFTLPYSVIRGEQVSIVTTVFNYMEKCATVRIRLTKTNHFQVSSPLDQNLCICGNEAKSVKYVIIPAKLGHIPLKVTVQNVAPSLCENPSDEASLGISDAVSRKLLVEPEGVRREYTYSNFICPPDNAHFRDNFNVSLPEKIVPGSVYATVSAIGDVMGPSLTGLEGLLRLPTGCGEQNMVKFAPNIFIMQYLSSTNQLTSNIKTKAIGFLRTGYQRELTYKRKDGSYSAFGDRDNEGSLWLTAFVLRSFTQARPFIFIDDEELKETTKWITSKQLDTGCFRKHGKLFHKELKGGVSTPATLTAYVVISLLESNVSPKSDVIIKALKCIMSQKDNVTDAYSNAIIAYALTLAKHPGRGEFVKRLKSQSTLKDGLLYWEKKEKPKAKRQSRILFWEPPYHRSPSANIEMTSYALMAMISDGTDSKAIAYAAPIVQWISKQRNALGGFSSTQDTCVALQALSRYAGYVFKGGLHMTVDVGNKQFWHNFTINDNNRLVLQRVEVPANILPMDNIPIEAVGKGCALLQVDVLYNVPDVEEKPAFQLSVNVDRLKQQQRFATETTEAGEELCQPLEMNVCAKWIEDADVSGMAVIDIKMVSGFIPDEESLERLMNRVDLNLMKFELEENKVVFYFDEIKDVCIKFRIYQTSVVKKTKPATVTVYEYYDTDKSATTMYNITEELCKPKTDPPLCPFCPDKPDLNALRPSICKKNTVISMRTLKNNQTLLGFSAIRDQLNSKTLKRKDDFPLQVTLPKGCHCAALDPHSKALVLLEKKKIDKKLKKLHLDENAMVLNLKGISTNSLAKALTTCP